VTLSLHILTHATTTGEVSSIVGDSEFIAKATHFRKSPHQEKEVKWIRAPKTLILLGYELDWEAKEVLVITESVMASRMHISEWVTLAMV